MDNNQKVVLGVFLGMVAGAVAGILLAPQAGDATRRAIADTARGYSDDLGAQLNKAVTQLTAYAEKVQGQAESVIGDVKEMA
jgi:gas vesicle protein